MDEKEVITSGMNRRAVLLGLSAGFGLIAAPHVARAAADARSLSIRHARTDEKFDGVYYANGFYDPDATAALDVLLRDYHSDEALMMDVRLFDVLAGLQDAARTRRAIRVTSGYRTEETNEALRRRTKWAAKQSLHVQGMAADIHVPGVSVGKLARIARKLGAGGVGSYNGAGFIHVDVGPVRYWKR